MPFFNIKIHKANQKRVLTFELVLEKFEDKRKVVFRSINFKTDRQCNGQMKNGKGTNKGIQHTTQKTKE